MVKTKYGAVEAPYGLCTIFRTMFNVQYAMDGGGAEVVFSMSGIRDNAKIVIDGSSKPVEAFVGAER